MAVKFPLKMADGAMVRTLEDLQDHFDLPTVLAYYDNGRLTKWLENGFYDEEAAEVAALHTDSADFTKKLCCILGVDYSENETESVDLGSIAKRNERLQRLKQYTVDDTILAAVDRVAFSQEELVKLLETEPSINVIYLCGERFAISANLTGITYLGVNHPQVYIGDELEGVTVEQAEVFSDWQAFKPEQLWRSLAEQDNAIAQTELGNCFATMENYVEAISWYMKAAE